MFSEEGKLSIHCLGESYLRQMGQEAVSRQDTRHSHNISGLSTLWDNYLTNLALNAMANGWEISMDQRPNQCREEYLGSPTFTQTLTIRTPSGHSAQIQATVTQESDIRRHVLHPSPQRNTTPVSGLTQSTSSTRALWGSQYSSCSPPCLSL